jgi:hypothetical protein
VPADVTDVLSSLRSCVGKRLDGVEAAIHIAVAREADEITQIALAFEEIRISLGTAGNGGLQPLDLAPITDMGDLGRIAHERFSSPAVGNRLHTVSRLLSGEFALESAAPVGVALGFATVELWIFNAADSLRVVNGLTGHHPTNFIRVE